MPLKGTPTWHLPTNRVLNKSWQPVKFAGYFTWTCRLIFFGNYSPLPPWADDVYLPFKHSNFCSGMLEMHSKRPRFQNFYRGHAPVQTHSRNSRFKFNACQWQGTFFPVLCLLQSFCHLLKTLLKTLYKDLQFGQNIFPSTCHMKYCIDLILGQAFFINENYLLSSPRFWMFCIE